MADLKIYRRSELEAIRPQTDAQGCLYRYHAIWVDGVDDSSDVALVGIGFHAIQHRYILLLRDNSLSQDAELAQAAFVEGVATAQTPSRLLPELRQVWDFHAETFELDLDRFVAAEEHGSSGDVGFTPDHVQAHPEENILEVIDYKSGWHPPVTEDQLRGLFQARVYSRYARDRWPNFSGYRFTLAAVRFKRSTSVVFSNDELDRVEAEVRAAIETIKEAHRTNLWPATAGPSCHFCSLDCPLVQQTQTLPVRVESKAMMLQLASWLLPAEKQVKAAKKLLKAGVAMFGPVTANGVVWDNRAAESKAYPLRDVLAVLEMRGAMGAFEDPSLTISRSALAKIFKAFPTLEDDLDGAVKTKVTYRFGAAKPDARPDEEEE